MVRHVLCRVQNVAGLAIQQKDGDSDTEPYEEYVLVRIVWLYRSVCVCVCVCIPLGWCVQCVFACS